MFNWPNHIRDTAACANGRVEGTDVSNGIVPCGLALSMQGEGALGSRSSPGSVCITLAVSAWAVLVLDVPRKRGFGVQLCVFAGNIVSGNN